MANAPPIERRAGPRAPFTAVVRGVVKEISPHQLKDELGGVDVATSVGVNNTTVVLANVEQGVLDAAVSAHVAKFPRREALTILREKAQTDPTIASLLQLLGY